MAEASGSHHLSELPRRIYHPGPPTGLDRHFQSTADLASCVSPSLERRTGSTGILNLLPITYASRPQFRGRLTLGGRTFPRKPWDFGDLEFNQIYRYLCLHSHFLALHGRFRFHFAARGTLSYHWPCGQSIASVHDFSPDHFRRNFTRWVSCYALFK